MGGRRGGGTGTDLRGAQLVLPHHFHCGEGGVCQRRRIMGAVSYYLLLFGLSVDRSPCIRWRTRRWEVSNEYHQRDKRERHHKCSATVGSKPTSRHDVRHMPVARPFKAAHAASGLALWSEHDRCPRTRTCAPLARRARQPPPWSSTCTHVEAKDRAAAMPAGCVEVARSCSDKAPAGACNGDRFAARRRRTKRSPLPIRRECWFV